MEEIDEQTDDMGGKQGKQIFLKAREILPKIRGKPLLVRENLPQKAEIRAKKFVLFIALSLATRTVPDID